MSAILRVGGCAAPASVAHAIEELIDERAEKRVEQLLSIQPETESNVKEAIRELDKPP